MPLDVSEQAHKETCLSSSRRFYAFIMPLLTLLADFVGCAGGASFLSLRLELLLPMQFLKCLKPFQKTLFTAIKSAFFGYTCIILSCWVGMQAEEPMWANPYTVVYTSVCILISDFLLTRFLMAIYANRFDFM